LIKISFDWRRRNRASLNLIVRHNMQRRRSVFRVIVAPIVVAVAFIPTLAIAVWEVLHGQGAESYSNVYGLSIQYTSLLIAVMALVLVVAVAYVARVVYFWRNGRARTAKLRESLESSIDPVNDK
jgi:ABC-type Fe3+ transport system permease subunit